RALGAAAQPLLGAVPGFWGLDSCALDDADLPSGTRSDPPWLRLRYHRARACRAAWRTAAASPRREAAHEGAVPTRRGSRSLWSARVRRFRRRIGGGGAAAWTRGVLCGLLRARSEEHTSELQSRFDLVCRLLL